MRSGIKVGVVGVIVASLLSLAAAAAYAVVWSSHTRFKSNGVSYGSSSYGDNGPYVGALVHRYSHGKAPVGKMGVRARIYYADGTLCKASAWRYNTKPTDHLTISLKHNCGGWLYSKGATRTWNGNGYTTRSTTRTPNWLE